MTPGKSDVSRHKQCDTKALRWNEQLIRSWVLALILYILMLRSSLIHLGDSKDTQTDTKEEIPSSGGNTFSTCCAVSRDRRSTVSEETSEVKEAVRQLTKRWTPGGDEKRDGT